MQRGVSGKTQYPERSRDPHDQPYKHGIRCHETAVVNRVRRAAYGYYTCGTDQRGQHPKGPADRYPSDGEGLFVAHVHPIGRPERTSTRALLTRMLVRF